MTKRISKQLNSFKYKGEPIKITIGTLALTAFCILLLIIATFTQITFTHFHIPVDIIQFLSKEPTDYEVATHLTKTYRYIPQIPTVFFLKKSTVESHSWGQLPF